MLGEILLQTPLEILNIRSFWSETNYNELIQAS
jgi:hypothetical protein